MPRGLSEHQQAVVDKINAKKTARRKAKRAKRRASK